jgi:hypothetical protein
MSEADDYRANLAVCWRMADKAPNEREKRAWLDMAESWRLLIWSTGEEFDSAAQGLGAMPAMFFVRIIQGAGAFLWLALDAFNRQRNAHYQRDTHRIGTASRGGDSRRNLTPSGPPPTLHQPIQLDQRPQVIERDEFHHGGNDERPRHEPGLVRTGQETFLRLRNALSIKNDRQQRRG